MKLKAGYKQTEVGVIPEEWEVVRLCELFEFRNGVNADKQSYGQGVPFINVLEVITKAHLRMSDIPGRVSLTKGTEHSYGIRMGDLVFNRTSETQEEVGLSSVYMDDEKVVFGGFVIRGRPTSGALDATYTGYALRSPIVRAQIIAKGQGAIRANVGQADLRQVFTPVPPFPEQREIAAALSDVDALIGALDKLIAKKRDIRHAAMQQLLTGQHRLPGFDGEWNLKAIGDEIDLLTGFPFPSRSYSKTGVRLLRGSNVKRGKIDWAEDITQYWFAATLDIARYELLYGDLVIAMDGSLVGRSFARLASTDLPALLLQRVVRIRSKMIDVGYLFHFIGSERFIEYCDSVKTVTAIPHISAEDIRRFEIPIPPTIEEQRAIDSVLSDMDAEIAALEARRDKTRALKQGMMQELLTGRIRLV